GVGGGGISSAAGGQGGVVGGLPSEVGGGPEVVPGRDRVAGPLVHRDQVVVGRVLRRGRAVGEGAQHVAGHLLREAGRVPVQAVAVPPAERRHPAHRPCVEHAGAAGVRVVGRVRVASHAAAGQRCVGQDV